MVQLLTQRITVPAHRLFCATLLALCCIAATGTATAVAQNAEYKPPARRIKNDKEASQLRKTVNGLIRSSSAYSTSDVAQLRRYYVDYIAIEMIQTDNSVDGLRFPEWRREIVRDILAAGLNGPAAQKQAAIRDLIWSTFSKLVEQPGLPPASRYNALLIVGELNDREQDRKGSTIITPMPSVKARELLLKVYNDPSESEAMKIGAQIGLVRHNKLLVAAGRPDAELVTLFRQILGKSAPDAKGTAAGLEWMKLLAIDGLGDAGIAADAQLLSPIVEDENAPELLRMAALKSLGRLTYRATDDIDEGAVIKAAAALTAKLLGQQVTETKTYLETHADEYRNSQRLNTADGTGAAVPEDPYVERVRQSARYQIQVAEKLLTGIAPAVTEPSWQSARSSLLSELNSLLKSLDTTTLQPQDFLDKISPTHSRLESILKSAA